MDLKNAFEYLVNLGREEKDTEIVEICGKTYASRNLVEYGRKQYAAPLVGHTLDGLIDYVLNVTEHTEETCFLKINSPEEVSLVSQLDKDGKRQTFYVARAETSEFKNDEWYDQERFLIEVQANFVETRDRGLVLQVAGNVQSKTVATYGDNGVTQKATISSGVATLEDVEVPNPVNLRPYRTFLEIEQPESLYVFRINDSGKGPQFKLVEAEGGLWKLVAIENIGNYLDKALLTHGITLPVIG